VKIQIRILLLGMFFGICGIAALTNVLIRSQAQEVDYSEFYRLIDAQIEAMRSEDYGSAYQYASTGFHRKFGIDEFRILVRSGYSLLVDSERLEYGTIKVEGNRALVYVFVLSRNSRVIPCIYSLVRERDSWKIEGARLFSGWPKNRHLGGLEA
jgi:hypothetical protein